MITKTKVIDGVYFISIPEANLYIQCGSPAESVKHLINKGFINNTHKNGVEFQTGPNAILFADTMIQNGEFSNMSEFSVLQMLYKQGLIIPNHPNNTGLKPLLIGDKNQVNAQMQYIYRGNYGLISQEEIENCGIDPTQAKEIYNMKLRFAFGELHLATKILDSCFVEYIKTEIRDDVFIKRVAINIFEISYKKESITIDLNLYKNQTYISPYTLPKYRVKKEYFSIIQSGQGDGWDTRRPSFNSIICFQGKYYLVDVVPNINYILESLSISINDIEGVFLTHCHDDHIGGITTLLRSDKKVKIYGTKIVTYSLIKKLSALLTLEEGEFQNLLDIYDLELDQWNHIHELEIKPILSPHSVETTMFIFRTYFQERYYSYGHFADIADSKILQKMIVTDKNSFGITQEFYDKTLQTYLQPLDIKKIDIGEGMIHGCYKDFIEDKSEKIILGHTNAPLSKEQLRVGTSSMFGIQDTLIISKRNYDYNTLEKQLQSNFPSLCKTTHESFLNFEIVDFNPKELLYKTNEKLTSLYLILDGLVEKSSHRYNNVVILEPGVIVGEKPALNNQPIDATFMTKNYVKALKIPVPYFHYFIKKYNLQQHFQNKFDIGWNFLNNTLFSENISYPTLNILIENMQIEHITPDDFKFDTQTVYLIIEGAINICIDDNILDTVTKYGYFGGLEAILNVPHMFTYIPTQKTTLYAIKGSFIQNIPVSFWKMLEDYAILQKKLLDFNLYGDDKNTFLWNHTYSINIQKLDTEHQKQLHYLEIINNYSLEKNTDEKIDQTLIELYQFSQKHFEHEENLMQKYYYDGFEEHSKIHQQLLSKILILQNEIKKNNLSRKSVAVVLKEWLLQHILQDDLKYSRFLNTKGIY